MERVRNRILESNLVLLAIALACGATPVAAASPSFDCVKAENNSVEKMICEDEPLARLDRKLAEVYAAAVKRASNERPPLLQAEQRGWIKGRNACWKSDDQRRCVADEYTTRIAALQAKYHLVPMMGPVFYACGGNPSNEVAATFFKTDPPTLIAERGDQVSLMYLQPSGSGSKYQGRNETLWEHGNEALITWGYGSAEMRCEKKSRE